MEDLTYSELQCLWGLLLGERRGLSASGGSTSLINEEIKQVTRLMQEKLAAESAN